MKIKYIALSLLVLVCIRMELIAQSAYLSIPDTRNTATLPADYANKVKSDFKYANVVGLPGSGYVSTLGLWAWRDDSGGPAHEMAFAPGKLYLRSGTVAAGWGTWRQFLITNSAGNVGVGTDAPQEKLSVNGKIRAHEVKVETTNWPDYVFENNYRLKPLSEVEQFIKINKHLPEVPSAKQVEADGVALGEMNSVLLKKVEELTLYLIEKDKEIQRLQKLEDRIERIESKLLENQ